MAKKITANTSWVGKTDWELKKFHGNEYSTHRGTTYNSYLVRDKKTALIDTVWKPFAKEFVEGLKKEIALEDIDFVIANHGEIDHSGALDELLKEIPDVPVYCTEKGIDSLKGQYHKNWNFHPVKTGDKINLGSKELMFIEAKMLHWPDSMFCYLTGDNILFSNDAFGQHMATEELFNDLADQCRLYQEAIKYYANILNPFSSLVARKIDELLSLNLPVDIICPSHGVIWRDNPLQIVNKYKEWSSAYKENQVSLVYDSMWNGTKKLAEATAEGIKESLPQTKVKLFKASKADKNDIITEIFKSKALLLGSPTVNRGILTSIAALLEEIKGLGFKDKKAASFGCYGWSGESPAIMLNKLSEAGFEPAGEAFKVKWNPDQNQRQSAIEWAKKLKL